MHRIEQYGNKMSVFGGQHNDHRWVEVYDSLSNKWIPVDPTMNVIGIEQWLKARVWFGERITIDTAITNDMIVPFTIFVTDSTKTNMIESRTEFYLVKEFDNLYNNKLSQLPSWNRWITLMKFLDKHSKSAFEGKESLHLYTNKISELADTYEALKTEYINFFNAKKVKTNY